MVKFEFDFKDAGGASIGAGYYQFDDIAPSVKASFSSLTNFSWQFDVPGLGLLLSSAMGDIPSSDSLVEEGILLSGSPGLRTLTFYDDHLTNILHRDISEPFPVGIQFNDANLAEVEYINNTSSGPWPGGTYIATEVPEPAALSLLAIAGLLVTGRRP